MSEAKCDCDPERPCDDCTEAAIQEHAWMRNYTNVGLGTYAEQMRDAGYTHPNGWELDYAY